MNDDSQEPFSKKWKADILDARRTQELEAKDFVADFLARVAEIPQLIARLNLEEFLNFLQESEEFRFSIPKEELFQRKHYWVWLYLQSVRHIRPGEIARRFYQKYGWHTSSGQLIIVIGPDQPLEPKTEALAVL